MLGGREFGHNGIEPVIPGAFPAGQHHATAAAGPGQKNLRMFRTEQGVYAAWEAETLRRASLPFADIDTHHTSPS
jgi:hypothetical protein